MRRVVARWSERRRLRLFVDDLVGCGEHVASDRLEVDPGAQQASGDPFDDAPLPDGYRIQTTPGTEPLRPMVRIAGEQTVGIDQLVSVGLSSLVRRRIPMVGTVSMASPSVFTASPACPAPVGR